MSERIRKLAEQANIICRDSNPGELIPRRDLGFEKVFAELIIKECLSSIQSDMDRETMNGTMSLAKHAGMVSAKTVIKKHFGVKE